MKYDGKLAFKLNENNRSGFYIMDGEEQKAELEISISGNNLMVNHTEVSPKAEGKGLAKEL